MGINIALDGPSGAGKSTIAKAVAAKMQYVYVDTGAMYRAVACYMVTSGTDLDDTSAIIGKLNEIAIKLEYKDGAQHVILNGEDVSEKIRTPEISMAASKTSAIPEVRAFLFDLQQTMAKENDIIMDGRDIGTVVLPNADVKIFLTASAEERANRRFKELQEKGDPSTYEEVLRDIEQRDYNDTHRETAPLKKAEDAIEVNTTELDLQQSIDEICRVINERIGEKKNDTRVSEKKERAAKPLMEIRPITKTNKVNPLRVFIYGLLRWVTIGIYHIYYDIKWEGVENVPKDGGNIFASNHRSYQDPVFIALHARVPLSYMAKEELFQGNKAFKWLITKLGAFPVARGKGDTGVIDTSIEKLEAGRNLAIFPEGTRSRDGKVGKGKTGVALIAAVAQTKIIPVGITFEGKLKFRKKVIVRYGKPIIPSEIGAENTDSKSLRVLKNKVMEDITDLVNE
ncbi:cytidylate kinase [Ruminococcus albus SY3]|uniref:Cytidylate kinase n=1 Tax=Ruminococcus albus SY3 TaxID=1341156 RepID=A0A011UXT4_RUMAL|nr:cytidylate kinase [Ruminococcus albus SY3]